MKRDHVNYLAAGATVVLALALLFAALYRITGQSGKTDRYFSTYDRVAGIRFGTPVYFEGYRVGKVDAIEPIHDGGSTTFEVIFGVEAGWPIPADSVAMVASSGLLSEVYIELRQGESDSLAEPGSKLEGRQEADLFAAVGGLATELEQLTQSELRPLLSMVHERVDSITGELDRGTPIVLAELESTLSRLDDSAASLQLLLGPDNRDHIRAALANAERLGDEALSLAEELRTSRKEFHEMVVSLHGAVDENRPEVQAMVQQMALTVADLSLRIDSIGTDLEQSARHFKEFTRAVRMRPNRLLFSPSDDHTEVEK